MQFPTAELERAISAASTIHLAAHVNPDGDSIGSLLALTLALRSMGKQPRIFSHDPVPQNLRFLPFWKDIEVLEENTLLPDASPDLGIVVDVGGLSRLGRAQAAVEGARQIIVIDHHQPSDAQLGNLRFVDTSYPATCLLLYDLFRELRIQLTKDIAQCLLTGIATDTGSFRYRNTDAATLVAAADLLTRGADITVINDEVYEKKPLAAIRLLTRALDNLDLRCNGQLSISHLTFSDFAGSAAIEEDTEGIVSEIGRINTVLVAALFREAKPGKIRVSVRSRGDIDVAAVCREFGGGGHKNAAGCTFEGDIELAKSQLVPALEKCVESCS